MIIRWAARILGLLLVAGIAVLAVGEGFNPMRLTGVELAMSAVFLMALCGMIVLWKWESLGGNMVLAGMLLFYLINFAASGKFPGGWVFPLCYLPGILSLISWSRGKWRLPTPRKISN